MNEKKLLEQGYRKYRGKDLDVYFRADLCTHSAVCVKGSREVFNVRKKPWIYPSGEPDPEKLIAVIDACPSGALKYIRKNREDVYMRIEQDDKRIYILNDENVEMGEIIFEKEDENTYRLKHTHVHEGFDGQGLGKKLVEGMAEKARKDSMKILPECPYAKSVMEKTDVYDDILIRE